MAEQLSPNKLALLKIRELKRQIENLESQQCSQYEPIAIVSMACRFPRLSNTPEKFWQSLINGSDEVSEIPSDRWDLDSFHDDSPEIPGRMYARHGVFLDSIDTMDPEFFGISPREATWIDPQQRLLMEVGWEALERAGWIPEKISDQTGVFVGWMHGDYQNEASDSFLNLNPYIATGAAGSFLCGRLSYYLGLQGPSVAVDTACSSSLVALHLACQSLLQRDCDRALVGGVNAIVSPKTNILTCKLKALSPTGQSRAFDAAADGYLRGEGCGVVALRRLSDAENDHDPILGVIEGSAIGHNGFSSGLTAPNPKAQERVIRQAVSRSGLSPEDIQYLEAHGTGTELGDPIEMHAAAAALSGSRKDSLLVGSVKTNIGHLEAAAGMAGLMKVLLAFEHKKIPGQLNFETPNPHINWDQIPVEVLTQATDWPNHNRFVAGVSAFGMSGTNAHVVVSNYKPTHSQTQFKPDHREDGNDHALITLSAKNPEGLADLASELSNALDNKDEYSLEDVAYTMAAKRSHFDHRAALVSDERGQVLEQLKAISLGKKYDSVTAGQSKRAPKICWQFTGQGSQYVGMAKPLYEEYPVFRQAIDDAAKILTSTRSLSLIDVLFDEREEIHQTSWTQPAIFSVQMALTKLLNSFGLQPDVVLGHSVGQYAAACVAGLLTWEDGLRLIDERGRLIGDLPQVGKMLAVFANSEQVAELMREYSGVSIAADNGTHLVISGDESQISEAEIRLTEKGLRSKILNTSHAFHSYLMEPILDSFASFADQFEYLKPQIPLICNISGEVLEPSVVNGSYWANHIRQPVQFARSIETSQNLQCEMLLEIGPQAVLTRMASANWQGKSSRLVSCLNRDRNDRESLLNAIGALYTAGSSIDWEQMYQDSDGRHLILPTYPFQRRRFWGPAKPQADQLDSGATHPLLGRRLGLAGVANETRYESSVFNDSPSWLNDHQVMGQVVMPGAAFLDMVLNAVQQPRLTEMTFHSPLQLQSETSLQTVVRERDGEKTIEIFSSHASTTTWQLHFSGKVGTESGSPREVVDLSSLKQLMSTVAEPEEFYSKMSEIGLGYGEQFQTIRELRSSTDQVLARLETQSDLPGYLIPPPLLDGALHSLAVGLLKEDDGHLFLPVGVESFECSAPVQGEVWCLATWVVREGPKRIADLKFFDASGTVVASLKGLKVQQMNRSVLRQMSGSGAGQLLYELGWQLFQAPEATATAANWLIVDGGKRRRLANALKESLLGMGHTPTVVEAFSQKQEWISYLADEAESERNPDGVIWLCGDEPDESSSRSKIDKICETSRKNCSGIVGLAQALLELDSREVQCGFSLITSAAISVTEETCDPFQSQYWGLGKVLAAEQPAFRCRLMDISSDKEGLAPEAIESEFSSLLKLIVAETKESQFVLRGNDIQVSRLLPYRSKADDENQFSLRPECSYLITGGLGILGRLAAHWLAENGAGQVVLVSRRDPDEAVRNDLNAIEELGCEVIVHSADIGSRTSVADLFQRFDKEYKPLAGVIHAAGVLDDGLIGAQSWERFENVLTPKIVGARLLDEFTKDASLDFFVLYSSVAAVLGSPGQSNYATGNAFLDGLANRRHLLGLPATSINWGPWSAGMADDARIIKQMKLQGMTPLDVVEAHHALEEILRTGLIQATVIDVDWRRMQLRQGGQLPPLLEKLAPDKRSRKSSDSTFVLELKKLRGTAQKDVVIKTVQDVFQKVLSTPDLPETDRPLIEMGLDSLMAVEFSTELQSILGEQIPIAPTMLFDHPTIDAISGHLLELISEESEEQQPEEDVAKSIVPPQGTDTKEPIAIIGMSCRFPGANSVDEFWENLLNGVDSVQEIPPDRWDVQEFYDPGGAPGTMSTRQGGFVNDIDQFDPAFFNISESEAIWIDPQHRMLLENSYLAMEDAGLSTAPLKESNVGVFMGIMGQDYAFLPKLEDKNMISTFEGAGLSHSAAVGRISYTFGFEGPSIAVDTASSSSLVALLQATRSLQEHNCEMALAGGVNAILAPGNFLLMSKAGLLAPDGRCKSFSASANGFGRGEGCGVLVLKRMSDAQRDGDRILATIRGGAVVHNGFSGGITSPNGKSQSRVIGEALKDARLAPSQVQYLEAHGTGTEFGDPMELNAAATVYGKGRKKGEPLLVGSVKANISHLEAAGGISGVIKTVLALNQGFIPPQAHFEEPSPHIPWKRLPVQIVTEPTPWPEVEERNAGVTALGLIGTNAHVILGGPPAPNSSSMKMKSSDSEEADNKVQSQSEKEETSELLVLSAKSEEALQLLVDRYITFLRNNDELKWRDVCWTAACKRTLFDYRIGLIAKNSAEAPEKLTEKLAEMNPLKSVNSKTASYKVAWSFPAKGDVLPAARSLYTKVPHFREHIDQLDKRLSQLVDSTISIGRVLSDHDIKKQQIYDELILFAFHSGLAEVWRHWGIEPELVTGSGIGEYSATCLAGGMSYEDAIALIYMRQSYLKIVDDQELQKDALNQFEEFADTVNYYPPNLPLLNSKTGKLVPIHQSLGGKYWRDHLSSHEEPSLDFSEKSHAILHFGSEDSVRLMSDQKVELLPILDTTEIWHRLLMLLMKFYEKGLTPNFSEVYDHTKAHHVNLPNHPFIKKRYWITDISSAHQLGTEGMEIGSNS